VFKTKNQEYENRMQKENRFIFIGDFPDIWLYHQGTNKHAAYHAGALYGGKAYR